MSNQTASPKELRASPFGLGALVAFIIAAVLILVAISGSWGSAASPEANLTDGTSSATPTATPTPSPTASAACEPEFVQVKTGHDQYKVDDQFAAKYAKATANADNLSDAQRKLLLKEAGKSSKTLAIWAGAFGLYKDQNDWKSLYDKKNNCLSSEGKKLFYKFEGVLTATGTTFEEATAPKDAWNSGHFNGKYGLSERFGVRGDRKAIKITLKDGSTAYILVVCGNPTYPDKDKPKNLPKIPSEDPGPRGNAPIGEGRNADPGPGTYESEDEVTQPPKKVRKNPKKPNPVVPKPKPSATPRPVPTPDPDPTSTPDPSAPSEDDPETGCDDSVPGVTC